MSLISPSDFSIAALVAMVAAAAVIDLRRHRIPNWLTMSGAILGLSVQTWLYGGMGLLGSLGGLFVGLLLFLPFYLVRAMGAGDVKLMAAAGAFLGWSDIWFAVCLSLVFGSLIGLAVLFARGGLWDLLQRYAITLKTLVFTGQFFYLRPQAGAAAWSRFPYAVAIAAGTTGALWWSGELSPLLHVFRSVTYG